MSAPWGRPPGSDDLDSSSEAFGGSGVTRAQLIQRGLAASLAVGTAGILPTTAVAATMPPRARHLPPGFARIFASHYIDANGLRQHAVIGGDGPPLLLLHGWPQNWYQFRLIMPTLARQFRVIAVDQRG